MLSPEPGTLKTGSRQYEENCPWRKRRRGSVKREKFATKRLVVSVQTTVSAH